MPDPSETGATTVRYANGNVKMEGAHLDGEMHGPWRWFRTDGTVMRTGAFERGRQVGPWRTFDRAGTLVKETDYGPASPDGTSSAPPTSVATSAASIGRGVSIRPTAAAARPISSGAVAPAARRSRTDVAPVGLGQLAAVRRGGPAGDARTPAASRGRAAGPGGSGRPWRRAGRARGRPGRRPGGGRRRRPQNPYVQLPSRSRIGQVAAAAAPPSPEHGPIRRSIHRSEPPPRATRSTGPASAADAAPARTARPVPRPAVRRAPTPRTSTACSRSRRRGSRARSRSSAAAYGAVRRVGLPRPGPSSATNPSQARSSSSAASNAGRDRCRSWSSIRSRTRPPSRAGQAPDEDRVRHVAEMEVAGRRRCEPRPRRSPGSRHDRRSDPGRRDDRRSRRRAARSRASSARVAAMQPPIEREQVGLRAAGPRWPS